MLCRLPVPLWRVTACSRCRNFGTIWLPQERMQYNLRHISPSSSFRLGRTVCNPPSSLCPTNRLKLYCSYIFEKSSLIISSYGSVLEIQSLCLKLGFEEPLPFFSAGWLPWLAAGLPTLSLPLWSQRASRQPTARPALGSVNWCQTYHCAAGRVCSLWGWVVGPRQYSPSITWPLVSISYF